MVRLSSRYVVRDRLVRGESGEGKEQVDTTPFALALVLSSAVFHATWNLLAKRAGGDANGVAFVWLYGALSALICAPLALVVVLGQRPHVGPVELVFMFGTGVLHLGYFLLLQGGYRAGDLSLVYPLARGTGPALSTAAAIAFFGERPTLLALSGVVLIIGGVFLLTREPGDKVGSPATGRAAAYGMLTGAFITAYTLWDKHAVSALLIPPVLLFWASAFVQSLLLAPAALRRREEVRAVWREHRLEALGVAVLSPVAYILVLTALVFSPSATWRRPARSGSFSACSWARACSRRAISRDASSPPARWCSG